MPYYPSGSGNVTGPASSTDNAIARYDGTTGKIIQDSPITVDDTTGQLTAPADFVVKAAGAAPSYFKYLNDSGIEKFSVKQDGTAVFTGNVTIPTAKITGGSPGSGKVLTSDADGDATWETPTSGGAPTDATYIVQTANAGLSDEQALGALSTGILKNTTTSGVLSIAAQGTDYYAPGGTDVAIADGGTGSSTAAGALSNLGLTATATELNYTDGVTSAIQTQLDTKITASSTDTLTNKTLTTPTIADLTNMAHDHGDTDDGGAIVAAAIPAGAITNARLATSAGEIGAAWADWTPSYTNITVGNGSAVAKYIQIGKIIFAYWKLTCGTTTSITNGHGISLPVTASSNMAIHIPTGNIIVFDTSASARFAGWVRLQDTSTTLFEYTLAGSEPQVTTAVPIVEGTGDTWSINMMYEAA